MPSSQRHRFRPLFVGLPILAGVLGVVVGILVSGPLRFVGFLGPVLVLVYFLQPAWRYAIIVDDEGIGIEMPSGTRRIAWSEVKELRYVPATKVCYVDGGEAAKSFLVTGPRAPGPYKIERREALYDFIVAHVPAEKRRELETLESRADPR